MRRYIVTVNRDAIDKAGASGEVLDAIIIEDTETGALTYCREAEVLRAKITSGDMRQYGARVWIECDAVTPYA